jgi:glycine cleavage system aminomethyltransferase T
MTASGEVAEQVKAIRHGVTSTVADHVNVVRLSGDGAREAVDRLCPCNVFLRDSDVRQTLLLDEHGIVLADVYLARDDDSWLLFVEGPSRDVLLAHIEAVVGHSADVENVSESHGIVSINGPFAWELMAALEGEAIVAFRYLSLYHPREGVTYMRAGKTGEFGYDLLVPRGELEATVATLQDVGHNFGLMTAGQEALSHCAFESWFFDIHHHSSAACTPLELGLQWRLDYDKTFLGSEAIAARRQQRRRRLTGLRCDRPIREGDTLKHGDVEVGTIVRATRSHTLGEWIGAAMIDMAYAHSGIDSYLARHTNGEMTPLATVSPPFVVNLSLFIDPQRHTYADRGNVFYPGPGG